MAANVIPPSAVRVLRPELLADVLRIDVDSLAVEIEHRITATALVNAARTLGHPLSDLIAGV